MTKNPMIHITVRITWLFIISLSDENNFLSLHYEISGSCIFLATEFYLLLTTWLTESSVSISPNARVPCTSAHGFCFGEVDLKKVI